MRSPLKLLFIQSRQALSQIGKADPSSSNCFPKLVSQRLPHAGRRDGSVSVSARRRPTPLSKSQLPTPPQKRSDGEGPGERPAAPLPPPHSNSHSHCLCKPPIQNLRAKARISGGIPATRGFHLRLPTVGTFGAKTRRPEEKPQHQTWSQFQNQHGTAPWPLNYRLLQLPAPTKFIQSPLKIQPEAGCSVGVSAGRRRLKRDKLNSSTTPPTSLIFEPSQDPKSRMSSCPAYSSS
jgi:hypothetical protein